MDNEDFEMWEKLAKGHKLDVTRKAGNEVAYKHSTTQVAWEVYQLAHRCFMVKLDAMRIKEAIARAK